MRRPVTHTMILHNVDQPPNDAGNVRRRWRRRLGRREALVSILDEWTRYPVPALCVSHGADACGHWRLIPLESAWKFCGAYYLGARTSIVVAVIHWTEAHPVAVPLENASFVVIAALESDACSEGAEFVCGVFDIH